MRRLLPLALALCALSSVVSACSRSDDALVIYSGRSKALVEPLVERYQAETGERVRVRYGGTAQLAIALMEEGDASPADLFWAQDAGALGALDAAGLLAPLGDGLVAVERGARDTWIATSGRARVLAYSTRRVSEDELPSSVFELVDPRWRGRVGWAPANASFQSFVTAMHAVHGKEETHAWLAAMRDNDAVSYPNNSALLQAIGAGTVDLVLTNHYYLLRILEDDPDFPAAQVSFDPQDIGNLINFAGLGILASSSRASEAEAFIEAMLAPAAQRFFAADVFEYPVIDLGAERARGLMGPDELERLRPQVELETLADLDETLALLRAVELL